MKAENDGHPPYKGYEYQILATAWVALDSVFRRKLCEDLVVEPPCHEDIALDLRVDPEVAESGIRMGKTSSTCRIQVKFRTDHVWTLATFGDVLSGGRKSRLRKRRSSREWPMTYLGANADFMFALLTNCPVKSELRDFEVAHVGCRSAAVDMPAGMQTAKTSGIAPRIGILPQLTRERLVLEISEILRVHCHVPHVHTAECLEKLKGAIRERLLSGVDRSLSRDELVQVVQDCNGFPSPPDQPFVPPSNMEAIRQSLTTLNAVILTGGPGLGKTHVARRLVSEHQHDVDPYKVIRGSLSPSQVDDLLGRDGRYLFLLEDPWGMYKTAPDADRWATELPSLMKRANRDKRFVITSRRGILALCVAPKQAQALEKWTVEITTDHFPEDLRKRLLESYLSPCAPWHRDVATRDLPQILRTLQVPLSISKFCDLLSLATLGSEIDTDVLIKQSNVAVFGENVAAEIRAQGAVCIGGAIALWALFMLLSTVTKETARSLRRAVASGARDVVADPEKVLEWLCRSRWAKDDGEGVSVHPTVLEGLETVVGTEPAVAEEVLSSMLGGYADSGHPDVSVSLLRHLSERRLPLSSTARAAIDKYLLQRVTTDTVKEFDMAFFELAAFSQSRDAASTLTRALGSDAYFSQGFGSKYWQAPQLSTDEIQAVADSVDAEKIARRFLKDILPSSINRDYDGASLAAFLGLFPWDMKAEWLSALGDALSISSSTADDISKGIISAGADCQQALELCLRSIDECERWLPQTAEERRAADQGELDREYAEHVNEEPSERFFVPESALRVIVAHRVRVEGTGWMSGHSHSDTLFSSCAESFNENTPLAELDVFLSSCPNTMMLTRWRAIEQTRRIERANIVEGDIQTCGASEVSKGVDILRRLLPQEQFRSMIIALLTRVGVERRLIIADAATSSRSTSSGQVPAEIDAAVAPCLSHCENDALMGCITGKIPAADASGAGVDIERTKSILFELAKGDSLRLGIRACWALSNTGSLDLETLRLYLACGDASVRERALVLVALQPGEEARSCVRFALQDLDYRCRRAAMRALAEKASEEEKAAVLVLASDKSGPVRACCAEIAGEHLWASSTSTLVGLLSDRRNVGPSGIFRFNLPHYHVARSAAQALSQIGRAAQDAAAPVCTLLANGKESCDDIVVHYELIDFLAKLEIPVVINVLMELLRSPWHMAGVKNEGFPLRYAAAWGLARIMYEHPTARAKVDQTALTEISRHSDGRLAGPCLITLGFLDVDPHSVLIPGDLSEDSEDRRLLVLAAAASIGLPTRFDANGYHSDGPVRRIIEFSLATEKDGAQCGTFIRGSQDLLTWTEHLKPSEGLKPSLRLIFRHLTGSHDDDLFPVSDLRNRDLAESLPILTMRSMFGGE